MTIRVLRNTDAITYMQQDLNRMLMHVVNCQGVMGSGIALQVKNRVPSAFEVYFKSHEMGSLELGSVTSKGGVLNLAAQDRYGNDRRHLNYGALSECFASIVMYYGDDFEYVIPYKMGCDRAGGDWEVVLEMIDYWFDNVTICAIGDLE